ATISPYRAVRDECRRRAQAPFVEVFVDVPLDVAEKRDVKGLYKKARAGEIEHFTGITDPYEPPLKPEVVAKTHTETIEESVARVLEHLASSGCIAR
ncbi:MAG: adenylyl-sulfate kinase, partial [Planctomycetota bacterium]